MPSEKSPLPTRKFPISRKLIPSKTKATLLGYIAFLDPPKESAGAAIAALIKSGVAVKIITGDNEIITRKICRESGSLWAASERHGRACRKFCGFRQGLPGAESPCDRRASRQGSCRRILGRWHQRQPCLKTADVGISVDTAVDIAKESADIILLEKRLMVL